MSNICQDDVIHEPSHIEVDVSGLDLLRHDVLCQCHKTFFSPSQMKMLEGLSQTIEQHGFFIFINNRGHHRQGATAYKAFEANLQPKPLFRWTKNVFFECYREVQTIKNLLTDMIFAMKIFF